MTDDDPTEEQPISARPATRREAKKGRRRYGKKQRSLLFVVLTRAFLGLFLLGVAGVVALFVIYQRTEIPQPNAEATKQQSIIYYDDGKTELARFNNTTREDVKISQVPEHVRYAFLSAEDRSFYDNQGVSPTGIGRALWSNLTGGQMQGGSTITQQYVKNYFLSQDRTISRKLNEVMIAVKLDNQKSKDEILTDYLNTIYFGRNAYGIQAASKAYFNKDVSKLTVDEGAFLASIINSPSRLDPANGADAKERVNRRMSYVINGMVSEGWLTQSQADAAKMPTVQARQKQTIPGPNGYIRDLVQTELTSKMGLTQQDIDLGGLRITTTINKKSQDAAIKAVNNEMSGMPEASTLHAGLVAQKPNDGAVVAIYGGRDPATEASNATYQRLQAASGFKTFGLIGALQDGMTLRTTFNGQSGQKFPGYPARGATNFGNQNWGTVSLQKATQFSINTAFLNVNEEITPAKTRSVAEEAGIPAKYLNKPTLANILGTDSVRVLDMATAYNTVAGEGVRSTPYFVKSATSTIGDYKYTVKKQTKRVFAEDVALNARAALETVVEGGSGEEAKQLDRPAAGKTGTASANTAVWFNGFTPQLTASVGMFKSSDGGKTMESMTDATGSPLTGSKYPTQIWTAFMKAALQGQKVEQFPKVPALKGTKTPSASSTPTSRSSSNSSSSSTPTSETSTSTSETSTSTSETPSSTSTSTTESSSSTPTSEPETSEPEPTRTTQTPRPTRTSEPPAPTRTTQTPRPTQTDDGDGDDPGWGSN
ncbi:transglycosylase domain-containing protein [Dermacoccaceae bacterium W4C1]